MSDFNASQLYFNCNKQMVAEAMHNCSNSNSSPDGINFCLLKRIFRHVVKPLNIVCQQSFNAGVFLADGNMPSLFHFTKERVTVLSRAVIGQSAYAAVWAKLWKS